MQKQVGACELSDALSEATGSIESVFNVESSIGRYVHCGDNAIITDPGSATGGLRHMFQRS